MQEKNMFIRKSAEAFIYSVFFISCTTLTRSAMLIKCSKKNYIFRKSAAALFCFLMPRLFGVTFFRLNAIGYCVFRKIAKALIFVRLLLRAAFCRGYTVWIAFAGFITFTFAVNLYYICECIITFVGVITFVVNYYICGFKVKTNVALFSSFCLWVDVLKKPCSYK